MVRITSISRIPGLARMRRCLGECSRDMELEGDVTIRLSDSDDEVREYNRRFREKDRTTDVLAFPFAEKIPGPGGGYYLGDILISLPQARRQARENGHSLERELLILMIHGLLHLGGYDHERDRGEMMDRQARLVAKHLGERT